MPHSPLYDGWWPFATITRAGVSVYIAGILHLTDHNTQSSVWSGVYVMLEHFKNMCVAMTSGLKEAD